MKGRTIIVSAALFVFSAGLIFTGKAHALENTFSGNYVVPESQSGFEASEYEGLVAQKAQRGFQNLCLGFLEVPHGVKTKMADRKAEYLPMTFEAFFQGAFHGFMRGVARTGVGIYEILSCPYAQGPIMEDMDEWLY